MTAPRRIVIQPYSATWPSEFARVEDQLREALGDAAERIDHIGSTSVPGLAAKDIIDVQIIVSDLADPRLVAAFDGESWPWTLAVRWVGPHHPMGAAAHPREGGRPGTG